MANSIMRSTDFRSVVEPILNRYFDGVYDQRADEYKQCFDTVKGIPRAYHEDVMGFALGSAPEVPDGQPYPYDGGGVLFLKRYQYKVYGLAFALTKVLVEDGDHVRIGASMSRSLAQALIETKETLCANILNRSFTSGYNGGDGKPLIATDHPIINGSFSNQLATAAALSQTSLEQILIQIRQAVDNNGKKIRLTGKKLIVPPSLTFQAEVLLKSVLRAGNANNDINPVRSMGMLAGGQGVLSRLTSTTAWWVHTDAGDAQQYGLNVVVRRGVEKSMEGDFETDSMRYKAGERYIPGWTDPRTMYGTAGA
jgi:hypothetical protein